MPLLYRVLRPCATPAAARLEVVIAFNSLATIRATSFAIGNIWGTHGKCVLPYSHCVRFQNLTQCASSEYDYIGNRRSEFSISFMFQMSLHGGVD